MLTINGIPFSMLFVLTALGVLIFLSFSLYRRLLLPIMLLKDNGQAHHKNLARLEILIWGIYIIVVIYYALVASLLVTLVLLVLLIFAFFDFWRNYFIGIVLKFGDKLQLGDSIIIKEHTGKIAEFGNRALKMVSTVGEEILIPYRLVNTEVKIGQKSTPKMLYKTFVIAEGLQDHSKAKQKIEKAIYTNPWIIISSPVQVTMEDQLVTLNFYVLNNHFFEKAKHRLRKDLGL